MSSHTDRVVLLAFMTLVGAGLGAAAYLALALAAGDVNDRWDVLQDVRLRLWSGAVAAATFVALAQAWKIRPGGGWLRLVAGALAGAIAGAGLYSAGYVAVFRQDVGLSSALATLFAQAMVGGTRLEVMIAALGAALGAVAARYGWRLPGLLAYLGLTAVVGGYVVYAVTVSLPKVPLGALPLSLALFVAESATLGLVLVYAFYSLDVFQRQSWERSPDRRPFSRFYVPKVAFHVATFNEPIDLVRGTLDALVNVDYPKDRYVVLVADDSTDAGTAAAIERMCEERGFLCVHRAERRGFKAGALNNALAKTPRDVEIIAVLDSDYQVVPEYLRETVGFFIDPNLGFLQTPQDYRNRDETFLTRQYYLADAYFYRAILPSRNEGNAIIFCGTMGMIRRSALELAGGWGEEFICEDAELSVRIFREGWDALYVNRTYGLGLIPSTFDAYKKQHTRWAFGCVKVLKRYTPRVLFSRVSVRQKLDFVMGNLHWFEGLFTVTIAAGLAWLAIGDALGKRPITHHEADVALVGLIPLFLTLDGILRIHGALRTALPAKLTDTVRTLGMWLSIKFATSLAAFRSLLGATMPFVRTPKGQDRNLTPRAALARAFRLATFETFASLVMLGASAAAAHRAFQVTPAGTGFVGRVLLAFWCLYYALIFACAPLYAYLSYRTFKEPAAATGTVAPALATATLRE